MKKKDVAPDEKLERQDFDLFKALDAIDNKNYNWYAELSEEQKKKFTAYMLTHWTSAIKKTGPVAAYYLMSVNEKANQYLFNEKIQANPELQWLMLCAASPGMGKQFHQWIPNIKDRVASLRDRAVKKDVKDYFTKIYPGASKSDIDEASDEYVQSQHHKYRLSKMYPDMKIADIEQLAKLVTPEDINEYERQSGN